MSEQITDTVLMVKPKHFGFNNETASSNFFQNRVDSKDILLKVQSEFNSVVELLRSNQIDVIVIEDDEKLITPDSVFPNNWFAVPGNGNLVLFPMLAANRRLERRQEFIDKIKEYAGTKIEIDITGFEHDNKFLEGTGSIVFDHINKIAYACLSPRTNATVLMELCNQINYKPVLFNATDSNGNVVYHTNVVMCVGENFALICSDSIKSNEERQTVLHQLLSTGHELIEISLQQMHCFAGNMLQLKNKEGKRFVICSTTAMQSLNEIQKQSLAQQGEIIMAEIATIETIGGGSIRCMLAEIFR